MAHEMAGVILVLTGALRCTKGRATILNEARGKQKDFFSEEQFIRKWIMYFETQLQYDKWLQKPEMEVRLVKRSATKLREYMNMGKVVGQRSVGMEYKTANHHGSLHVGPMILELGVPSNYDSFNSERHHKANKKTAQRTQKKPDKFNIQMARKIQERQAVEMGMEEINGRKRWQYYNVGGFDHSDRDKGADPFDPILTGVTVKMFKRPSTDEVVTLVVSKMKAKDKYKFDAATTTALVEILDFFSEYQPHVLINSCLKVYLRH